MFALFIRKMRIIINIEKDLTSLQIKEGKKIIDYKDLTAEQQTNMLNALASNYHLFFKFRKK